MKVSQAGLDLIKKHEGLRLTAYRCPAGVWTIGYGITSKAGVGAVTPGMKITQPEAEEMLRKALLVFERGVQDTLTRRPTQPQFDAMVSLAYNIGVPAFRRSSVARHFNNGDIEKAAGAFLMWNKANGKVLPGLTRRRADERAWFLRSETPVAKPEPKPPVPNDEPVLRPAPPLEIEPAPEKPGKSLAAWILAGLFALIAAAAAFVVKGN